MSIAITAPLLEQLLAEAAADPDREICGLLFGNRAAIQAAERTTNVAAEPADSFEIDPAALFRAIRRDRAGGARLIGYYHSHPNGRAEPSVRDEAGAEPGTLWLIIAGQHVRLWRATRRGFREEQMNVN